MTLVAGAPIAVTVRPSLTVAPTALVVAGSGFTMQVKGRGSTADKPTVTGMDVGDLLRPDADPSVLPEVWYPNVAVEVHFTAGSDHGHVAGRAGFGHQIPARTHGVLRHSPWASEQELLGPSLSSDSPVAHNFIPK